ncbi:MAG: AtpZ/AtpI family protein [Cyclobacteriaceae bacterium]|jgi:F0F1-type ATP synthase assembly protein I
MNPEQEKQKPLNPFLKYSALAIQMAGAIAFAAWIGFKLDQRMGTSPVFLIVLIMTAFFGLVYQLWIDLKKGQ